MRHTESAICCTQGLQPCCGHVGTASRWHQERQPVGLLPCACVRPLPAPKLQYGAAAVEALVVGKERAAQLAAVAAEKTKQVGGA